MSFETIKLDHLSFTYHNKSDFIIENLDLRIPSNTITCILGRNGVGKTTLLLLLLGIQKPTVGRISYSNNDVVSTEKEMKRFISFLPQNEIIPRDISVSEYTLLGRLPFIFPFSLPSNEDYEIVNKYEKLLDISHLADMKINQISGGELQRVRICRALVQESDLILFDEPVTHLDLPSKYAIMDLLTYLKSIGKTIIFTTHDPIEALHISDHSMLFYPDKRIQFGLTRELINNSNLTKCFEIPINIISTKSGYACQVTKTK